MGVVGWDFIHYTTSAIKIEPSALAIDVPNYFLRRLAARGGTGRKPMPYVSIALKLVEHLLQHNILPVFIFDGPPESLKRAPNPNLLRSARRLYNRFLEKRDPFDHHISTSLAGSPSLSMYFMSFHLKDLLAASGVPTITAPSEAEMTAAALARARRTGSVLSNDVDTLLFGSPHLTKGISFSKGKISYARLSDLKQELDLDLVGLRDLAILCGCDFHEGLRNVGPRRGATQLKRYGSLEDVLRANGIPHSQIKEFILARDTFYEADRIDSFMFDLTLRPPNPNQLKRHFLPLEKRETVKRTIKALTWAWKTYGQEQTTLEETC
ncbi:MAG: hypothetical protein ACOC38_08350 [Promethearchaeia archaeon]